MRYIATVHAYDVMNVMQVVLSVREYPDNPEEPPSNVFSCTTAVPGIGESDPRQWAVDALVGLLEAM